MKKNNIKKPKSTSVYDSHRQQNVLLEEINKQVKTVAEGHGILVKNIDEIKSTLSEHNGRFDRIETVVSENRKDIKELKVGQEKIITRLDKVEQKLDTVTTDHEHRIQKLESVK